MEKRCAPAKLRPLTPEARELARQNFPTIARFLSYHRLTDEWFDVVIFRYLLTVQNWLDRPELRRYAFTPSRGGPCPAPSATSAGSSGGASGP